MDRRRCSISPYSTGRNPYALAGTHRPAGPVGRSAVMGKDGVKRKFNTVMRKLQSNPEKTGVFRRG